MAVLTRHARLLYVLALFQLLGGPLVLGGLMMVTRLMADREMTVSESVSRTLEHLGRYDASAGQEWNLSGNESTPTPAKPAVPRPKKVKDTEGKLWAVSDLRSFLWSRPVVPQIPQRDRHDPVPRRRAHAPPLPPPRLG